jgi:hypothetical protein
MFSTFGYYFAADVDGLKQNAVVQHEGPHYQALHDLKFSPYQSKCYVSSIYVTLCEEKKRLYLTFSYLFW